MESPDNETLSVGRKAREKNGMRRSDSERSSTDSDILVASAKEGGKSKLGSGPSTTANDSWKARRVVAEIRNASILVIRPRSQVGRYILRAHLWKIKNRADEAERQRRLAHVAPDVQIKNDLGDDAEAGPNHRGTYSKEYTLKHPEVKWVHRGQGRYLPSSSKAVTPLSQAPQ